MSKFISKKLSLFLLLGSWFAAAAMVFFLNFVLDGPKLGPVYDMFIDFRPNPPVSSEILLIDTEDIVEPDGLYSVLMALSEMDASDLLVVVPVLGAGSGRIESGAELSERVSDEFRLLGKNIRNLFEAIRLGFVGPKESPAYVDSMVELAERGRDRLNAAIIRQEEAGSEQAVQAAAAFGRAIIALDLRMSTQQEIPWYSQAKLDSDRVLRRIAPVVDRMEHIAYHVLKQRWAASEIEVNEKGQTLVTFPDKNDAHQPSPQDVEPEVRGSPLANSVRRFPLDRDGNILVEKPGKSRSFRRLGMNLFLDYDEADRSIARLLKDADEMGVFAETAPEDRPLILLGFAEDRKEEMLKDPDQDKRAAWIKMRLEYLASLDEFLYGPSEMTLVNRYEEIISSERLGEAGLQRLQEMRDRLIRVFVAMREKHRDLVDLRTYLAKAADGSFCIMGPAAGGGAYIPESSALLANTLLTGICVTPGQGIHLFLWPLLASLAALSCIFLLRPLTLLIVGIGASIVNGAAFGAVFVFTGYWIDPFIPMGACLLGTLVLFIFRFSIGYGRALRFRLAYAPFVEKDILKALVKAGRPLPSETVNAHAAIIAVKKPGMLNMEDKANPLESKKAAAKFREDFLKTFKKAGAVILGFEGDVALACFGSPLERIKGMKKNDNCSLRAARMVEILLKSLNSQTSGSQLSDCRFGIEAGDCVFSWSEAAGYTANGRAVIRAKLFCSLAKRCNVRAIIGETAKKESGRVARKLSSLNVNTDGITNGKAAGKAAGSDENGNFYELGVGK
ncbi:MAG: hypothetical protein LBC52_03065 [Treponema sp.]|jgi:hypothetical protein|nr:hypothetical protein [Treponema sp.]